MVLYHIFRKNARGFSKKATATGFILRRRSRKHISCPAGGLPGWSPADRAIPESTGGACLSCCPPTLTLVLILPPSPQPPSPPGKGETFSFLMQGASPLASPGLDGARHWLDLRLAVPGGGLAPASSARRALAVPGGGLPSLPPATPAFSLAFCPHPPAPPSPPGKGETFSFLMQGASPLASPGLDGARHWLDLRLAVPCGGPAWKGL